MKQVTQFAPRVFNKSKDLYMHGWVQEMSVHPEFHWAHTNSWVLLTKVELLDVLPADHTAAARCRRPVPSRCAGPTMRTLASLSILL
ncbi:hypothetical protein SAMN00120144_3668 [Hymenobacter roseosalivarius DSM 11622]|uniref:Uncharacterized protein n=1 Tax=Hymenobacter roseosalivarius DSM 11622 TaxID=645990 RepID=A0A1W1W074_9BACT|nr:glycoside hydrolase family 88 protein [Hymenobacter roseosalivarius]SMB99017.1 hypothetical protein SAMN00120144_3668 [Hymenobacter roseosalivarius DSM 11622]